MLLCFPPKHLLCRPFPSSAVTAKFPNTRDCDGSAASPPLRSRVWAIYAPGVRKSWKQSRECHANVLTAEKHLDQKLKQVRRPDDRPEEEFDDEVRVYGLECRRGEEDAREAAFVLRVKRC